MRRYPIRQTLGKRVPDELVQGFPGSIGTEGGVRNAKRQRANAVKTISFVNVIFEDQVQSFRHVREETLAELQSDILDHFCIEPVERRHYELRDCQGGVLPTKGFLEDLFEGQGDGLTTPEATLHLILKKQESELHQSWKFDSLKDLRTWRVDPAVMYKYRSVLSEKGGVIRVASTQAVPVTEENPVGILLPSKDFTVRAFGRDTWTVTVSDFKEDSVEPDAYGAMLHCSPLGYFYDHELKVQDPDVLLDEDPYTLAGIDRQMAISCATMGFMWNCAARTLMMFEVLPTGAWRFQRQVDAIKDLTQPVVYVRRRYAVERLITIKTGLPPPSFCLL